MDSGKEFALNAKSRKVIIRVPVGNHQNGGNRRMLWIYLLVINLVTLIAFGADKRAAVHGRWRTPEATLLGLCLIGGAAGGLIAMHVFHHKTRKMAFAVGVPVMLVIHIVLVALWLYWF